MLHPAGVYRIVRVILGTVRCRIRDERGDRPAR